MTITELTEFLGWILVINIAVLLVASFMLIAMRGMIVQIHGKMLGLSENDLLRAYTQYLAQYKIAVFVFNLAPYLALKLMG